MAEVTADFAIKYLLDDCDDCPENKDGECMTQSHCFEVKYLAIKALEQEPKTGYWIEHPEIETSTPEYLMFYECSECGNSQCFCKPDIHKKRFCSNCGCRMIEPQESEDRE